MFIKYCIFSLKCCNFSELCQICSSAGVLPAIQWSKHEVYTPRKNQERPLSGLYFKILEKTQYLMNTLYNFGWFKSDFVFKFLNIEIHSLKHLNRPASPKTRPCPQCSRCSGLRFRCHGRTTCVREDGGDSHLYSYLLIFNYSFRCGSGLNVCIYIYTYIFELLDFT